MESDVSCNEPARDHPICTRALAFRNVTDNRLIGMDIVGMCELSYNLLLSTLCNLRVHWDNPKVFFGNFLSCESANLWL